MNMSILDSSVMIIKLCNEIHLFVSLFRRFYSLQHLHQSETHSPALQCIPLISDTLPSHKHILWCIVVRFHHDSLIPSHFVGRFSWKQTTTSLCSSISNLIILCLLQNKTFIYFSSSAPGRGSWNFKTIIFKLSIQTGSFGTWFEIPLWWMPQNLTNEMSTLVQIMAWCRLATNHYLSQWWSRSMSPYGVTRPWCVKNSRLLTWRRQHISMYNMPIGI